MAIDPMNVWASMEIGAAHKKKFEAWLANKFIVAGLSDPAELARHIVLLMDGLFSTVLIHRDADYAASAARAAHAMVVTAPRSAVPDDTGQAPR